MIRLLRRLRYLLQRDRHERELDDELRFHLEMKQQELQARGLDRAAAAATARRALGNLPLTRDHVRDVWIAPWLQRRETVAGERPSRSQPGGRQIPRPRELPGALLERGAREPLLRFAEVDVRAGDQVPPGH